MANKHEIYSFGFPVPDRIEIQPPTELEIQAYIKIRGKDYIHRKPIDTIPERTTGVSLITTEGQFLGVGNMLHNDTWFHLLYLPDGNRFIGDGNCAQWGSSLRFNMATILYLEQFLVYTPQIDHAIIGVTNKMLSNWYPYERIK